MAHHWSPSSQLQRTVEPDVWIVHDDSIRIAIIRRVPIGVKRQPMFRAVTYAEHSEDRILIGYAPTLSMAADIVWHEWLLSKQRRNVPVEK